MADVYRHFDSEGTLLYVGWSLNSLRRLADHMKKSYWRHEIATVTIQRFETPSLAMAAEAAAIRDERPIYNQMIPDPKAASLRKVTERDEAFKQRVSEKVTEVVAARKAAGVKFGRAHKIKDNPTAIELARQWQSEGVLEPMTDRELLDGLNANLPKKERINSIETIRRWRRAGYPGIEQERDVPMSETEPEEE